ncbi:hypothetical protein ABBQ32_013213 [Trebouxia sp. C0010 RCD-2024]
MHLLRALLIAPSDSLPVLRYQSRAYCSDSSLAPRRGFLAVKSKVFHRQPHTARKESKASNTMTHARGRVRDHHDVCQCLSQGQHAHVQQEGPDISNLHLPLQQQWDLHANAHLGNIVIKPQSKKRVWWRCDQCPDGHLHTWSAVVQNRSNSSGCPQCSGYQVCKHNSLATKAPLVAAQWDYGANTGTPDNVVAQSDHPVNWHCKACGCKWEATPNSRVSREKAGCPQCANDAKTKQRTRQPTFAACNHPLLAEWDYESNAAKGHFPGKVRLRSNKQIFWLCTKCPATQKHSWSAAPHHRTGRVKTGCPFCARKAACRCNSLQALCPDIAAEWDYSKKQASPATTLLAPPSWLGGPALDVAADSRPSNHVHGMQKRKSARSQGAKAGCMPPDQPDVVGTHLPFVLVCRFLLSMYLLRSVTEETASCCRWHRQSGTQL